MLTRSSAKSLDWNWIVPVCETVRPWAPKSLKSPSSTLSTPLVALSVAAGATVTLPTRSSWPPATTVEPVAAAESVEPLATVNLPPVNEAAPETAIAAVLMPPLAKVALPSTLTLPALLSGPKVNALPVGICTVPELTSEPGLRVMAPATLLVMRPRLRNTESAPVTASRRSCWPAQAIEKVALSWLMKVARLAKARLPLVHEAVLPGELMIVAPAMVLLPLNCSACVLTTVSGVPMVPPETRPRPLTVSVDRPVRVPEASLTDGRVTLATR